MRPLMTKNVPVKTSGLCEISHGVQAKNSEGFQDE